MAERGIYYVNFREVAVVTEAGEGERVDFQIDEFRDPKNFRAFRESVTMTGLSGPGRTGWILTIVATLGLVQVVLGRSLAKSSAGVRSSRMSLGRLFRAAETSASFFGLWRDRSVPLGKY